MLLSAYFPASDSIFRRSAWYVQIRFWFLIALGFPSIISNLVFNGFNSEVRGDTLLLAVALLSNGLLYLILELSKSPRFHFLVLVGWLAFDILLVTSVIWINGAIESRSPILYAVPIVASGALFGRRGVYTAAIYSGILYDLLLFADFAGWLPSVGVIDPDLHGKLSYVVNSACFIPSILIVIALSTDFTARLLQEKEGQASHSLQELNRAQKIAKIGSWEWNVATDSVQWSDGMYEIFERPKTPEPVSYAAYLKMIHPDDVARHRKVVHQAVRSKQAFSVDHRILMADGSVKYLHGEGVPVLDKDGHITMIAGTAQDVTDAHHLDNAKRDFVALASHQLRTPASGVRSFLSLLLDGYAGDLNSDQRDFINKAYNANLRQLHIIENLLNVAALESGKLTPKFETAELGSLLSQCIDSQRPDFDTKQQSLTFKQPRRPAVIKADPSLMQMVIDNLISNASKYTLDGGKITIQLQSKAGAAILQVKDSGIGIAAADIPALFQRFGRLDNPQSKTVAGTGLGLYIADMIVRQHRGTIAVKSRQGKGSTFTVTLPLADSKKYTRKNARAA